MPTFAVIGAGNAGCAYAAHLKLQGQEVRLTDKLPAQLEALQADGNRLHLEGELSSPAPLVLDLVTTDLAAAVDGADFLLCTVPAHFHRELAQALAPCLRAGQQLLLTPGRTGGALEVAHTLAAHGGPEGVVVVEAQSILYACRRTGNRVQIFGLKQRVPCAGRSDAALDDFFATLQAVFPQFVRAPGGLWETSLHNIGMLFHPGPTLLNLGRMEAGVPFDYYIDGFTPSIAATVERLDAERRAVAQAMGLRLPGVVDWLRENYGATGESLYDALQTTETYKGIKAPALSGVEAKRGLRYVVEDVPTGLVPTSELGRAFAVKTPAIDAVIALADLMYGRDFRAEGRNLARLGLGELAPEAIVAL